MTTTTCGGGCCTTGDVFTLVGTKPPAFPAKKILLCNDALVLAFVAFFSTNRLNVRKVESI